MKYDILDDPYLVFINDTIGKSMCGEEYCLSSLPLSNQVYFLKFILFVLEVSLKSYLKKYFHNEILDS